MTKRSAESEALVLEALKVLGGTVANKQIVELIGADLNVKMPDQAIGHYLFRLEADGKVKRVGRGFWKLADTQPARNGTTREAERVQLTEEQRNRPGIQVAIYTEPTLVENVVMVKVKPEFGGWVKLPIWGNIRICLGPGEVDWGVDRISNRGITLIQLVMKNGATQEIATNPAHTITFAPEV